MINQCIDMFEIIKNYKFILKFTKNNKTQQIEIMFHEADFFHLVGLHYIKDVEFRGSKVNIYRKIVKDKKFRNRISNSRDLHLIEERLIAFSSIQTILNSNFIIYKYIQPYWTDIEADFVLKHRALSNQSFIFLKIRENSYYVACSVIRDKREFVSERNRYKTIYKKFEKIS